MNLENYQDLTEAEEKANTDEGVLVVNAGGQISQRPNSIMGVNNKSRTQISRFLDDTINPRFPWREETVDDAFDKQRISASEREKIIEAINGANNEKVVILTVPYEGIEHTSKYLDRLIDVGTLANDKVIVVTGSQKPIYAHTDADVNLGFAIGSAAYQSDNGISVAMNGELIDPQNIDFQDERFTAMLKNEVETQRSNLSAVDFFVTGGTIDGRPNKINDGTVEMREDTIIPAYLEYWRLNFEYMVQVICMKDSRDILESDRKDLFDAIKQTQERVALITHGTYTMSTTARYIIDQIAQSQTPDSSKLAEKLMILYGSMVPLHGYIETDAGFNTGFAAGVASQKKTGGVYVAMNGKLFRGDNVHKDVEKGVFEEPPVVMS